MAGLDNYAYPESSICEDGTVLDHEAILEQSGLRESDPEEDEL